MKKPISIFVIGLFISVVLPLISIACNWFGSISDINTKLQIVIGIGLLAVTILATYLSHLLEKTEQHAEKLESFNDILKSDPVVALDKAQLYSKLSELVLNANEKMELMYLGDKPPDTLEKFRLRDKYITNLEKVIRAEKNDLQVKRIILYSDKNKEWIKDIANKFNKKRFFSLYVIKREEMPSMSIQIIDSDKVIVINILKKAADKKNFYTHSKDLNLIFHGYYLDTLEKSIPIIENGILNVNNFQDYFS